MNPEDLMYLRPEDLTEEERAELAAYLAAHPEAGADNADVDALVAELAHLPDTDEGPSLDALLARLDAPAQDTQPRDSPVPPRRESALAEEAPSIGDPANTPRWVWSLVPVLVAAAAVVLVVAPGLRGRDDGRDRGGGGGPIAGDVTLEAVAQGPVGPRALTDGDRVAIDERVVFFAVTRVPGHLTLSEGDEVFWPGDGGWEVGVGRHAPGPVTEPLSYRPDVPIGQATYRARLCAGPDGKPPCAVDELVLRW